MGLKLARSASRYCAILRLSLPRSASARGAEFSRAARGARDDDDVTAARQPVATSGNKASTEPGRVGLHDSFNLPSVLN